MGQEKTCREEWNGEHTNAASVQRILKACALNHMLVSCSQGEAGFSSKMRELE